MKPQTRAYVYAFAAILCWSTVASAFKLTLTQIGVVQLLFLSTVTSFVVLTMIAALRGSLGELRQWKRRHWLESAGFGLLNPFLYYLVLFRAYDLLPAQEAQPLNYTWPIVLVLLSVVFLGQPVRWRTVAAMLVSFVGVAIISTRGDVFALQFTSSEGVLLAVGSSLIWASYWILNMRSKTDPILRLSVNFFFGTLYVLILFVFTGASTDVASGLLGSVYVGLFEMGLTFFFWMQALRLSSTTARISNLVFLSPFLSLLIIHLVVGEEIYASTVVGLLLIVGGIVIQRLAERSKS
jgi:drug/metabolite transporter (DMT)-like permease